MDEQNGETKETKVIDEGNQMKHNKVSEQSFLESMMLVAEQE